MGHRIAVWRWKMDMSAVVHRGRVSIVGSEHESVSISSY